MSSIWTSWTGRGRHRVQDRLAAVSAELAAVTADRDRWQQIAEAAQAKLAHADALITRVCEDKSALLFSNARIAYDLDLAVEAHQLLALEYDELAHRLIEQRAENANLRAITPLAAVQPVVPVRPYDPEATEELPQVRTLQDAKGLRAEVAA